MSKETFLYPMLYLGPKTVKNLTLPGSYDPIVFEVRPDAPYLRDVKNGDGEAVGEEACPTAFVTEIQGRHILKRWPGLYAWPDGIQLGPVAVTREEFQALQDEVAAVKAQLAALASKPKKAAEG